MAKKSNGSTAHGTSVASNYRWVRVCAFCGIVLSGVAGVITFILNLLAKCGVTISWGGSVSGVCSLIAQIALYISVWLAAWDFVRGKGRGWKIVYWVFFVLSILGLFGLGLGTLF